MTLLKFTICLLLAIVVHAQPTTLATPVTVNTTDASTTNTTEGNATELLRHSIHFGLKHHKIRGRVVLATTHEEGSEEWGVTAEQAEESCHRIAQIDPNTIASGTFNNALNVNGTKIPMEGHLISVGTTYEVLALSRLLHPLPDGPFWTGGRIVRYRRHNSHDGSYTDHVILTWNDGRSGDLSVLGMTKEDKLELKESYVYCLALNLLDNTWQARDCADKLPYACLITPKRLRFSNAAQSSDVTKQKAENAIKKFPIKNEKTDSKNEDDSGKLMQNEVEQTEVEQTTTPAVIVTTEAETETTIAPETTTELDESVVTEASILSDVQTTEVPTEEGAEETTVATEASILSDVQNTEVPTEGEEPEEPTEGEEETTEEPVTEATTTTATLLQDTTEAVVNTTTTVASEEESTQATE